MPRALLVILLIALPCRADEPSLRALCIRADAVVLATPLDPVLPTRFTVREVLRGKARPGHVINSGLKDEAVRSFDGLDFENGGKPRPRRSEAALLFFKGDKLLGLRLCTEKGRVMGLDANRKVAVRRARWPEIVLRVRQDVATVDHLRTCRAIPVTPRRVAALTAWITRHRTSLGILPAGPQDDESPAGWEELGTAVFDWITESGGPANSWQAVRLYADIHGGELLRPRGPVFASREGRAFLLERARDKSSLAGERERALALLSTADEKTINAVASLLTDEEDRVKLAAVATLARLDKRSERVKEAIVAAYRQAKPGPVRGELGWLACDLVSPSHWRELTRNPAGVAVVLREMEQAGPKITFWLHLRTGGQKAHDPPAVVLETLNVLGFVTQTKRKTLELVFAPRPWKDGWSGGAPLAATFSLEGYPAGTRLRWRIEGFVGQGAAREQWRSEPHIVKIPTSPPRPSSKSRGR